MRKLVLPLSLATSLAASAAAQPNWNDRGRDRGSLGVEVMKPLLKASGAGFANGAAFVVGTARLSKDLRFEAELPIAHGSFDQPVGSGFQVGNPYIGLAIGRADSKLSVRVGLRAPTASEPNDVGGLAALATGLIVDITRFEAFVPKVLTARTSLEFNERKAAGLVLGARVAPAMLVSTEGGDPELYIDYGGRIGYQSGQVLATLAIAGRLLATESDLSLGERTIHSLIGSLELRPGRVRPTASFRLPLDSDERDVIHGVIGIGVTITW